MFLVIKIGQTLLPLNENISLLPIICIVLVVLVVHVQNQCLITAPSCGNL